MTSWARGLLQYYYAEEKGTKNREVVMSEGWPDTIYVISILLSSSYPLAGESVPLVVELPSDADPEQEQFLAVFRERVRADEFVTSAGFDMPGIITEVPIERFPSLLDIHVESDPATHVLVDPSPIDKWGPGSEKGVVVPARELAEILREDYTQHF